MAEFLNRDLRVNEAVEKLSSHLTTARAGVGAIPLARGFTTAPNGQVLDRAGNIVYTPTLPAKPKP